MDTAQTNGRSARAALKNSENARVDSGPRRVPEAEVAVRDQRPRRENGATNPQSLDRVLGEWVMEPGVRTAAHDGTGPDHRLVGETNGELNRTAITRERPEVRAHPRSARGAEDDGPGTPSSSGHRRLPHHDPGVAGIGRHLLPRGETRRRDLGRTGDPNADPGQNHGREHHDRAQTRQEHQATPLPEHRGTSTTRTGCAPTGARPWTTRGTIPAWPRDDAGRPGRPCRTSRACRTCRPGQGDRRRRT